MCNKHFLQNWYVQIWYDSLGKNDHCSLIIFSFLAEFLRTIFVFSFHKIHKLGQILILKKIKLIFSEKNMVFVNYLPTMQCPHLHIFFTFFLKYGFLKKSFNYECTFVSWPFPVITFLGGLAVAFTQNWWLEMVNWQRRIHNS